MDWTTVIVTIGGLVSVEAIFKGIDRIRYKPQDKKLKNDEVQKAETTTDQQQIDLGDLFLEKTQKWAQIIENSANKVVEANARRDDDWKDLKADMVYVKGEVGSIKGDVGSIKGEVGGIVEYLNGDYQNFKKNGGKNAKRKVKA